MAEIRRQVAAALQVGLLGACFAGDPALGVAPSSARRAAQGAEGGGVAMAPALAASASSAAWLPASPSEPGQARKPTQTQAAQEVKQRIAAGRQTPQAGAPGRAHGEAEALRAPRVADRIVRGLKVLAACMAAPAARQTACARREVLPQGPTLLAYGMLSTAAASAMGAEREQVEQAVEALAAAGRQTGPAAVRVHRLAHAIANAERILGTARALQAGSGDPVRRQRAARAFAEAARLRALPLVTVGTEVRVAAPVDLWANRVAQHRFGDLLAGLCRTFPTGSLALVLGLPDELTKGQRRLWQQRTRRLQALLGATGASLPVQEESGTEPQLSLRLAR